MKSVAEEPPDGFLTVMFSKVQKEDTGEVEAALERTRKRQAMKKSNSPDSKEPTPPPRTKTRKRSDTVCSGSESRTQNENHSCQVLRAR